LVLISISGVGRIVIRNELCPESTVTTAHLAVDYAESLEFQRDFSVFEERTFGDAASEIYRGLAECRGMHNFPPNGGQVLDAFTRVSRTGKYATEGVKSTNAL
jgi:hypothetical protein